MPFHLVHGWDECQPCWDLSCRVFLNGPRTSRDESSSEITATLKPATRAYKSKPRGREQPSKPALEGSV
ncbi:hypothetical protein PC129_g12184 [Phytophthora cactorum]|uniref:Uncharacterized protein n=1 Tax=Phytophthora cactorum TaxID=29920 RepID=A0A8T1HYD8_9STRA|nr:hypothetical protein PC114_g14693 [Phytophthora cactorum]KAG2920046.1 hypothetical protein PC117_g16629 [Phytophthora cactorum]KAG3147804.1 hypothetical protein C6341_g17614 [Phytophthora cactorum]KAG3216967.1 hypothetical protein PC129_g12184 [Phytophthora cactorum]